MEPPAENPSPAEAELAPEFPRLDLPSKVDGSFLFAGDVRLPGMVYASIRHGPLGKPELSAFDAEAIAGLKGLVGVVRSKRYLAAVAESWWIAERALSAMKPRFIGAATVESAPALEALDDAFDQVAPERVHEQGDPDGQLDRADYTQTYSVVPAVHATIETASATARYDDGKLELWIAAQAPELTRRAARSIAPVARSPWRSVRPRSHGAVRAGRRNFHLQP